MSLEHVLIAAGYVAGIGAAITLLWRWPVQPLIRFGRKLALFLEDWNGIPARPGVEGRPGVMEQLATLHANDERTEQKLAVLTAKAERTEWHVGNGNPVPLRKVVEAQGQELRNIKEQLDSTD